MCSLPRKLAMAKQTASGNNPDATRLELTWEEIRSQTRPVLGTEYRRNLKVKLKRS